VQGHQISTVRNKTKIVTRTMNLLLGNVQISYDGFLSNFRPQPMWPYSDVFNQPFTYDLAKPPSPYDGTRTVWANPSLRSVIWYLNFPYDLLAFASQYAFMFLILNLSNFSMLLYSWCYRYKAFRSWPVFPRVLAKIPINPSYPT